MDVVRHVQNVFCLHSNVNGTAEAIPFIFSRRGRRTMMCVNPGQVVNPRSAGQGSSTDNPWNQLGVVTVEGVNPDRGSRAALSCVLAIRDQCWMHCSHACSADIEFPNLLQVAEPCWTKNSRRYVRVDPETFGGGCKTLQVVVDRPPPVSIASRH